MGSSACDYSPTALSVCVSMVTVVGRLYLPVTLSVADLTQSYVFTYFRGRFLMIAGEIDQVSSYRK